MTRLSIHLLGSFQVLLDGAPVTGFESDKVRALLVYLVTEAGRPHRREALAALLWPDHLESTARGNLRNALFDLRGVIGDRAAQPPFLLTDPQAIWLNPTSDHVADASQFATLMAPCEQHRNPRVEDCAACVDRLEQAVALYKGGFLEEFSLADSAPFEEWAALKREQLQRVALLGLEHLAACYELSGEYGRGLQMAQRQLDLDPLREQAHRQLMLLLALSGRRGEALAQYEACTRTLAQELQAAPDAETRALMERIRDGALAAPSQAAPVPLRPLPEGSMAAGPIQAFARSLQAQESAPTPLAPLPLYQLPPSPADFIGREEEVGQLLDAVQNQGVRIISVRGTGGMGKTSLALRLAERLAGNYPDGQFYIEMHALDAQPLAPAEAMAHVIRSFHPLAQLPTSDNALAALYRSVLQGKRALILLDNARGRAQVEPLLPPASCLLMVTTRWRFALPGLHPLDLQAQPLEQAVQMLRAIAPRLTQEEAGELARACGGMPLGLRVAGSALAEWDDLPVEEYLADLAAAQERLPEELTAVESSLALSDALLNDGLRARWYALSVFPETFDRAGAQAAWALASASEAQRALSELLQYSLIEYDRASRRYRLHDLCRAYAAERLEPALAEDARMRHAAHYAQVFREADRQYVDSGFQSAGLELFDRERANILAGQAWAASRLSGAPSQTSGLDSRRYLGYVPPALGEGLVLIRLLVIRVPVRQRVAWWQAGLRAARQVGDRHAEMRCLLWLAMAHRELGRFRPLHEAAKQALAVAEQLGERGGEAAALHQLSFSSGLVQGPNSAISYCERCIALTRELRWLLVEALALRILAHQYLELEQPRRGLEYAQQAWAIARELYPAPPHRAYALQMVGRAYAEAGDPRRGLEDLQGALALFHEWGFRLWEANTLLDMGRARRTMGDLIHAQDDLERALAIGREIDARAAIAETLDELGQLYAAQGGVADTARAASYYEQALAIWGEVGSPLYKGRTLWHLTLARDAMGERQKAIDAATQAFGLLAPLEHPAAERVRQKLDQWRGTTDQALAKPAAHQDGRPT